MKAWVWLLAGVVACAISWAYMHRVLLPWQHYVDVERVGLKVEMGDLYPRWVGTRELLLHGLNPYGTQVSQEIQMAFYGHTIEQRYDNPQSEIVDEQRFAYPLYVVFLLAPTVHVEFEILQRWAPVVLGGLTVISVWLWVAVLGWRVAPWLKATLALLVLSSPQIAQGMRLRQFGLLVAFLLALATWCVTRNRLFLAGALLAVGTIKPQMVSLCLVWFFLWCLGDWKKRWPLIFGFAITLGLLAGAAEILVPGWLRYFIEGLEAYRKYFPTTSPLRLLLGDWIGGLLSLVGVILLLRHAWSRRRVLAESHEFAQTISLFFVVTVLVLPLLTPYNQVLLLLPVLMLIRDWKMLPTWSRAGFSVLMAWPYVCSAVLLAHPPQLHSLQRTPLVPVALTLLIPFVAPLIMFARSQTRVVSTSEH
jgi:hypothetical protein